jgi:hypothetical protein
VLFGDGALEEKSARGVIWTDDGVVEFGHPNPDKAFDREWVREQEAAK